MQKRAILILGIHRSGTSVVSRLLNLHGIRLPSQFVEPNQFNERGYWESPEVQNINDAILTASNSAWFDLGEWTMESASDEAAETISQQILTFLDREFSGESGRLFALKDPRICRLAPVWMNALGKFGAEVSVVIPYRNPLEVAASLKARDGIGAQVAFNLWLRHVLDAEHFSRDCERAIVSYENLISNWQKEMQTVKAALHLDWPERGQEREAAVNEFLSASLRHQKSTTEQLGEVAGVDSLVYRTYRLLRSVRGGKSKRFTEAFTRLRSELNVLVRESSPGIPHHIGNYVKAKVHHPREPGQIAKLLADRFSLKETMLDLVIRKNALESQVLELDAAHLQLETQLQDVKGQVNTLQGALTQKTGEIKSLNKASHRQRQANQMQAVQIKEDQVRIEQLEDEARQLKETVYLRFKENQALNAANRNLSRRVVSSAHEIQALKQKLHAVSAELNSPSALARRMVQRSRRLLAIWLLQRKLTRMILASGAFDRDWYLKKYPDVAKARDPLFHYLVHGADEGRNPSAYFDSSWYLESNPDVARQGVNPLVHYLTYGVLEGRDPNPYFSTDWYVNQNPEVNEQGLNPLTHFIQSGDQCGRAPSRLFDSQWYLAKYTDVARAGLPPFYHFITYGKLEDRLAYPPIEKNQTEIGGQTVRVYEGLNVARRAALGVNAEKPRANIMLVAHSAGIRLFGAERSFLDVCKALDSSRYNVFTVVPTENRDYIESLKSVSDYVYCFPYNWWRKGVPTDPLVIKVFAGLLRKHSIELLYGNTIMLREPFMAAREQNIPSVLHAREIISQDPYLQETIGLPAQSILDDVVERADFLLANSRATCREFGDLANTRLLYNTVSSEGFTHLENIPGPSIYVGLISSNIPKKGLEDFIKLALLAEKKLPQFVFRVIGPETAHSLQLQASLADKGVGHNVEFCGYIDDVAEAIAKTNIVVNFSHFAESFGRTPAEAMMARRPVIVYDHGALPELVVHGETGFVIPYRKYREALPFLQKIAEQPGLVAALGEAGRQRATELFDAPVFGSALQAAFSEMLASGAETRRASEADQHQAGSKLKIAYFLWHFPVPSETFVLNELRFLVEGGHDVMVFCRQSPHPDFVPDFEVNWTRVTTPDELAEQLLIHERALVHSHFVYPTVTDFLWPACEQAKIEFTFIAHAQDIFRYVNEKANRIGELAQSRWCKQVLVPGRFHRQYLAERGVPEEKIFINPQGIDTRHYPFGGGEDKPESRRVCCVQRFVEKKGIEDLIQAAPLLAKEGIQVDIYGYGPLEESYQQHIERLGVTNVSLHGALKGRAELISAISASDLFVTPCIRAEDGDMDGIPTVFMEAMALGTPVVTTDISSIPDLVVDGLNGLVCESNNPVSISEAICKYYAMPKSRRLAMRRAARRHVETKFHTEKTLRRLLDLYQDRTVDIVIVSWNNVAELKEVVRRLLKFTGMPYRLIINDNHSEQPVIEFLQELEAAHEQVTVIWQEQNLYVGPGTNEAVQAGKSEYVIYICGKEGFALQHNWERQLVEYMDANREVGLAGTLGYSPTYLTGAGYSKTPVFSQFRNKRFAIDNPDREFRHVQGGLFILRRKMYEEIGGFSEAVPHSYTDVEYSFYVESCGWKLGQVPGMLALYNKTRPGIYSRLTEEVRAIHPPRLDEAAKVEQIAQGKGALCNMCAWYGDQFKAENGSWMCPDCGSLPGHRKVWRFLADSALTYRRLSGLYINPREPLFTLWQEQFKTLALDNDQIAACKDGLTPLSANNDSLDIIFADDALQADDGWLLGELHRVLSPAGVLLVRQSFGDNSVGAYETVTAIRRHLQYSGFKISQEYEYGSRVVRYDWLPLLVCRK